jgi:uncharacterized protein (TIGR02265 family)
MFEGLYVNALRVPAEGSFADDLRAVGIELRELRSVYATDVWRDGLDVAWRHCYPHLSRYEGWRRLGRDFINGYLQTVVGRFIASVLPLLTAERFVDRVPSFVRTGIGGSGCESVLMSPCSARVTLRGPHEGAAFLLAGVFEECFERMRIEAVFTPSMLGGEDSCIDLTWKG